MVYFIDDLYKEEILDHYWSPHNHGALLHPTASASDENVVCGDRIQIDVLISDWLISDIRFSGEGCAISQAASSMLTDAVKGKTLQQAQEITEQEILQMLGIPVSPARTKCALLGWQVMRKALIGLTGH